MWCRCTSSSCPARPGAVTSRPPSAMPQRLTLTTVQSTPCCCSDRFTTFNDAVTDCRRSARRDASCDPEARYLSRRSPGGQLISTVCWPSSCTGICPTSSTSSITSNARGVLRPLFPGSFTGYTHRPRQLRRRGAGSRTGTRRSRRRRGSSGAARRSQRANARPHRSACRARCEPGARTCIRTHRRWSTLARHRATSRSTTLNAGSATRPDTPAPKARAPHPYPEQHGRCTNAQGTRRQHGDLGVPIGANAGVWGEHSGVPRLAFRRQLGLWAAVGAELQRRVPSALV